MPGAQAQQVTPAGDYIVGTFSDVTTINYWAANGPDNTVYNSFMLPPKRSLYGLTPKYFTLVPDLAAVPVPTLVEEGDFWVAEIPMRQDVTWQDGEVFDANDVVFTIQTVKDFGLISGNWSNWFDFNYLDRAEAVDDYTVKLFFHTKPGLARYEYGVLAHLS
jgi:peptide/nickel transport system substrate-binding protein